MSSYYVYCRYHLLSHSLAHQNFSRYFLFFGKCGVTPHHLYRDSLILILNMTLAEFSRREYENHDSRIITVMDNKTKATAGPAMLPINCQLTSDVSKFLKGRNM